MSDDKTQEKDDQPGLEIDPAAIDDWGLRMKDYSTQLATVTLDGEDVILVENLGNPLVHMKPLSGDFSIVNYFAACARSWVASFKRPEHQQVDAAELWLEFKAIKEKLGLSASEFLEQLGPQDEAYAPGRF